ncbi:MAG: serine hydrolase domain-containing protein [Gemmatimonadaceae bacterium]
MKLQKQRAARVLLIALGAFAIASIVTVALSTTPPRALTAPAGYYVHHVPLPDRLPAVAPESVGMSAERLNEIATLVTRGVAAGGFPGAAVVIGRKGGRVMASGFGHTGWSPRAPAVSGDSTEYDLASLTKVVATTSAIMALYDDDVISLDDPVSKWVPSFSGGAKDRVTIRDLLTHRSGLPPGRNVWKFMGDRSAAKRAVISTSLVAGCPPGSCFMYSDLGADMLGFVAEAAAHEPLDRFTERRIFGPLGMTETTFNPDSDEVRRLAPTGAPRGRVHDSNAAALGGVAGHAGLFSTASDLAVFAQMLLDGGEYDGTRIFREGTVALFTKRTAGTRALGWDTCDSANVRSTCGRYLSARAFGHTGFTGTSLWIDPDREMFMILLTNRVDDPRVRRPERVIHDIRADIADAAVLSVIDARASGILGSGTLASSPGFRSDNRQRWQEPVSVRRVRAKRARARINRGKHGTRTGRAPGSRAGTRAMQRSMRRHR